MLVHHEIKNNLAVKKERPKQIKTKQTKGNRKGNFKFYLNGYFILTVSFIYIYIMCTYNVYIYNVYICNVHI